MKKRQRILFAVVLCISTCIVGYATSSAEKQQSKVFSISKIGSQITNIISSEISKGHERESKRHLRDFLILSDKVELDLKRCDGNISSLLESIDKLSTTKDYEAFETLLDEFDSIVINPMPYRRIIRALDAYKVDLTSYDNRLIIKSVLTGIRPCSATKKITILKAILSTYSNINDQSDHLSRKVRSTFLKYYGKEFHGESCLRTIQKHIDFAKFLLSAGHLNKKYESKIEALSADVELGLNEFLTFEKEIKEEGIFSPKDILLKQLKLAMPLKSRLLRLIVKINLKNTANYKK